VKRFRGGLVVKAHRLLYHSTLGSRVIKKKTGCDGIVSGEFLEDGAHRTPRKRSMIYPPRNTCTIFGQLYLLPFVVSGSGLGFRIEGARATHREGVGVRATHMKYRV